SPFLSDGVVRDSLFDESRPYTWDPSRRAQIWHKTNLKQWRFKRPNVFGLEKIETNEIMFGVYLNASSSVSLMDENELKGRAKLSAYFFIGSPTVAVHHQQDLYPLQSTE